MKLRISLALITIISSIFLTSCSEASLENDLVGSWKQISVGHIPEGTEITWTFSANHFLYQTKKTENSIKIDTAFWQVQINYVSKNSLVIENLNENIDGKHLIHSLDTYLKLQRVEFTNGHTDGSFIWSEFEKK